ncbi:MAG: response regulator [Desulfomonile tiedjei]|uniref:Response regulator n=1 Tax=Desulfomonile tiedjei TaxID=2358 RepID=A0A9D6V634_9BACT|nr:response regulator [Desulfomonile tiedjei]
MSANETEKSDRIKLLLVDDEVAYVNILAKRLTKRNFDVTASFSGIQGIQAVRKEDFDVAVLDLKMEDADGIEVLKLFKKMAPNMEVIMLTGHGSEQAAREGVQFGAYDYLTKPCELDDLVQKIKDAARQSKSKP